MAKYREIFVDAIIVLAAVAVDFIINTYIPTYVLQSESKKKFGTL